ncbi:MAG TPA: GNAT family N-acetyltransferase [Acidimicrobiia bacterium]|nr:GNAT family N-acetyltransferase [Acidimicrobiia bacterium]
MEIRRLDPDDATLVLDAAYLFDSEPTPAWTSEFLARDDHHLLVAFIEGEPVGFVSGVEIVHPDKQNEMLLYELGVDENHRRRGIGTKLVEALKALAIERGSRGMWVVIDDADEVAASTYLTTGATERERAEVITWDFR